MFAKTLKYNLIFFLLLFICGGISLPVQAKKPPANVLDPANPMLDPAEDSHSFEYVLEGRPDPFVPFITKEAARPKLNPDEIIDEDVELTGMRLFEPGQLRLVAVLETGKKKIAMVEDVTGKGYTLNEGTPIGRHGIVTKINLQQVIITETAHTRSGKEIKNTIVMRLNKEGEQ